MTPSDLVALVARLKERVSSGLMIETRTYLPSDRTDTGPTFGGDYRAAIAAIEQLQAELSDCHRVITIWDASDLKARPAVEQYARAERAETEAESLRAELAAVKQDAERLDWAAIRSILAQGADIHKDYMAGNHATYEDYAVRLDHAAHERLAAIDAARAQAGGK